MRAADFEPGTMVEIQAGRLFPSWNGRCGTVVDPTKVNPRHKYTTGAMDEHPNYAYVYVKVVNYGVSGWRPDHLRIIQPTIEEVEAITGVGYFD